MEVEADPPAPADVATVALTSSGYTSLAVGWSPSPDAGGVLAGYEVFVDGTSVATLAPDVTSHTIADLTPATAYTVRVATFDAGGKQSIGTTLVAHTLVANPTLLEAAPGDERATLSWVPAPAAVLEHYALYQEPQPFGSVEALIPVGVVSPEAASAVLTSLVNGATVHVAVVAVNLSDAFDPTVASAPVTPADDVPPKAPIAVGLTSIDSDSLTLAWAPHPEDTDVVGYDVTIDGGASGAVTGTSHTFEGLAPATGFALTVASRDEADNVSEPSTLTGYTLVPNPTGITLVPHDKSLTVTWTPPDAAAGSIGHHALYVLPATYVTVAGMTPPTTVPAGETSATLTGLANGQTWYVAVTTVNTSGGETVAVTPVAGVPVDDGAPPAPTDLEVVDSGSDSVTVAFTPSADPDGDLAAYRVYVDDVQVDELPHGASEVIITGLAAAAHVVVGVTAVDAGDNEGLPATVDAYTWLANPAVTVIDVGHERLTVAWESPEPAAHIEAFAVYVDDAPFDDVTAMTPAQLLPAGAVEATVLELANGFQFWVAVTAVTKSGGEDPVVSPAVGEPAPDAVGPVVEAVLFDGAELLAGGLVVADGAFEATVTDDTGVEWVRFIVDGLSLGVDQTASDGWTVGYVIGDTAEGEHTLEIVAGDVVGNTTTHSQSFVLAIAPPAAPVISDPLDGAATNQSQVLVAGSAKAATTVTVYLDGSPLPGQPIADAGGGWSVLVTLVEGSNVLTATATNAGGEGEASVPVSVLFDASVPAAPKSLIAQAAEGGVVHLDWFDTGDAGASGLAGYRVYRSEAPLTGPEDGVALGAGLSVALELTDVPPSDGTWHYGVTAWNLAGTEGALSNDVAVVADSEGPTAEVVWTPSGPVAADGRVGPGEVQVDVTFSEDLLTEPFFTLAPAGGLPIGMGLAKVGALTWRGGFTVGPSTGSGEALVVMSARDEVGNRGTVVTAGGSLLLDAHAPEVVGLQVTPGAPIANDAAQPATVTVTIELDEPLSAGETPALSWALTQTNPDAVELPLAQLSETTWSGPLTLPPTAGEPAEALVFSWLASDDLGNVSTTIAATSTFEVYQGELPALQAPLGLTAKATPGGGVKLTFSSVTGAAEYQLLRQGPSDNDLVATDRIAGSPHEEVPGSDGVWQYAVASVRHDGGEESLSDLSPTVPVTTDSEAPLAPVGLTALLAGNGIVLEWSAPPGLVEPVTYSLFRSAGQEISTLDGLEPLAAGIGQLLVVDPSPSGTEHAYAVAAVDAVGNQSAPSGTAYLNADLLPVGSLEILHAHGEAPVLTWTHPAGDLAGFVVAVDGTDVTGVQPEATWADGSWADGSWDGETRTYAVRAVDQVGEESLPRELTLPAVALGLADGTELLRGVIQTVPVVVDAAEELALSRAEVAIGGDTWHRVGGPEVVVGGAADWAEVVTATLAIELSPNAGELVRIEAGVEVPTRDDTYAVEILDAPFTAGADDGEVQLVLHNTHAVEIELLTATDGAKAPSSEVRFVLLDLDDNVLSTVPVFQGLGEGVVTTSSGHTVARVAPGESWTSAAVAVPLPEGVPDDVRVRVEIDALHHHIGKADHAQVAGLQTSRGVSLTAAPYDAEVLSVTPESSTGDDAIEISGRAFDPATGDNLPDAVVKVVVSVDGFDRDLITLTDGAGDFTTTFEPLPTEGGVYVTWANHPDVDARLPEATFTIQRVFVTPTTAEPIIAANYPYVVPFEVSTALGTTVTALRLEPGALPTGVTLDVPAPVDLGPGQGATLEVIVTTTNEAPEATGLVLDLVSDEGSWGGVQITYLKTDAAPSLSVKPPLLVTGVARGDATSESLTLENKGLSQFRDVELSLLNATKTGPAAPWLFVSTGTSLGDIGVGEQRAVTVSFAPSDAVAPTLVDPYSFFLRVSSQGDTVADIPVYASVDDSGVGGHLFKVSDIYTGTLRDDGSVIEGLAGAKVKLDKAFGTPLSATLTTDALGEVLFEGLTVGTWKARLSAPGHEAVEVALSIKPGLIGSSEVLLPTPLIVFEWEVTETTIEDEYIVVLQAVFETDVPAPVVIAEPVGIELPDMAVGDVLYGETTLTNHGLIRADDLTNEPPNVPGHKFELLVEPPKKLEAKEQFTIPWRVTRLEGDDHDGDASGAGHGCGAYSTRYCYLFTCANGLNSGGCAGQWITRSGGGGGGGCGIDWAGGGGGGGGWLGPIGGFGGGPGCDPCNDPGASEEAKSCCGDGASQDTGSSVQLITGGYVDDADDLLVGVRGFDLVVGRAYTSGDGWRLVGLDDDLSLKLDAEGSGNVIYRGTSFDQIDEEGLLFASNDETIERLADGTFRYLVPRGGFRHFDADGLLVSATALGGATIDVVRSGSQLVGWADASGATVVTFEWDGGRVIAAETWDGRRVEYAWDGGDLLEVSGPEGLTVYEYDNKGRLAHKVAPNGTERYITWSDSGVVSSVLDGLGVGAYFSYGYNSGTRQYYSATVFTDGTLHERWYADTGEVAAESLDGNEQLEIELDGTSIAGSDGFISASIDRVGIPIDAWKWTSRGQLAEHTDERGVETRLEYDDDGILTRRIEAAGTSAQRVIDYEYGADGELDRRIHRGEGGAPDHVYEFSHDEHGNWASITGPTGSATARTVSPQRHVLTLTRPDGAVHEWVRDERGWPLLERLTPPTGEGEPIVLGEYAYEVLPDGGDRILYTDASGETYIVDLDVDGRIVRGEDGSGRTQTHTYDASGRIVASVDLDGRETTHLYEALGFGIDRATRSVDGAVVEVTDSDAYGRVVRRELAGEETLTIYDGARAEPAEIVHPDGSRQLLSYDDRARRTKTKWLLGDDETLQETYGWDGPLLANLTRPNGGYWAREHDPHEALLSLTNAAGHTVTFARNHHGHLTGLEDGGGVAVVGFERDARGRADSRTFESGETVDYTWDAMGRLTGVDSSEGAKQVLGWDVQGQLTSREYFEPGETDTPSVAQTGTWDAMGRPLVVAGADATRTSVWDDFARSETVTVDFGAFAKTYTVTRDAQHRPVAYQSPEGTTVSYTYDGADRLVAVSVPDEGDITWAWPAPGSSTRTLPGGGALTTARDPLGRTTRVETPAGTWEVAWDALRPASMAGPEGTTTWSFDAAGRVDGATYPTQAPWSTSYDARGQRDAGVPARDARGRVVERDHAGALQTLVYDAADRLVAVETPDGQTVATYAYDATGRRVSKTVGGETTYFLYGHFGLQAEYDGDGTLLRSYGWRPELTDAHRRPLWVRSGAATWYYVVDLRNAPLRLVDGTGAVVGWSAETEAFGRAHVAAGAAVTQPLRLPGQYADAETGLHYNVHRYYDPDLGLFTTRDPLAEQGGDTNLWRYAFADPLRLDDPSGLGGGYHAKGGSDGFDVGAKMTGGAYWGLGGELGAGSGLETDDCCGKKNGQICYYINASAEGGVGWGAKAAGFGGTAKLGTLGAKGKCRVCSGCRGKAPSADCSLTAGAYGPSIEIEAGPFKGGVDSGGYEEKYSTDGNNSKGSKPPGWELGGKKSVF